MNSSLLCEEWDWRAPRQTDFLIITEIAVHQREEGERVEACREEEGEGKWAEGGENWNQAGT